MNTAAKAELILLGNSCLNCDFDCDDKSEKVCDLWIRKSGRRSLRGSMAYTFKTLEDAKEGYKFYGGTGGIINDGRTYSFRKDL